MKEYPRYLLIKSILGICPNSYEYKNIIERWILTMANMKARQRTDAVLLKTARDAPLNTKMERELIEKGILSERGAEEFVGILVEMVSRFLNNPAGSFGLHRSPAPELHLEGGKVEYGQFSFEIPVARMELLRAILREKMVEKPEEKIARMIMRYASLGLGSQQWSVPPRVYRLLYDRFGVRLEGFASPINSQLLAIDPVNSRICSLFYDTDVYFNSLGDFFAVTPPPGCAMVVNPPFIEDMLARSAQRCLDLTAKGVTSFFIMPHWEDSEAYRIVSEGAQGTRKLAKGRHYFYDAGLDKHIKAKFNSTIAIFSPTPPPSDVLDQIQDAFASF